MFEKVLNSLLKLYIDGGTGWKFIGCKSNTLKPKFDRTLANWSGLNWCLSLTLIPVCGCLYWIFEIFFFDPVKKLWIFFEKFNLIDSLRKLLNDFSEIS